MYSSDFAEHVADKGNVPLKLHIFESYLGVYHILRKGNGKFPEFWSERYGWDQTNWGKYSLNEVKQKAKELAIVWNL